MDLLDVLNAPPAARRRTLDAWRRARADAEAAEQIVRDLVPLFDADDVVDFLNAEGMWVPLAAMATASSGRVASTLWAWAAASSWVVGDHADAPCDYAVRALRADPSNEDAWQTFTEVVNACALPELADDVRGWADDPEMGPAVMARARAILDAAG